MVVLTLPLSAGPSEGRGFGELSERAGAPGERQGRGPGPRRPRLHAGPAPALHG